MSLTEVTPHRPSGRASPDESESGAPAGVGVQTCYRRACWFRRWTLGFRQCRFSPIAQALQGAALHVFSPAPALRTCACSFALSGPGELFASESVALNSGQLWWQFLGA